MFCVVISELYRAVFRFVPRSLKCTCTQKHKTNFVASLLLDRESRLVYFILLSSLRSRYSHHLLLNSHPGSKAPISRCFSYTLCSKFQSEGDSVQSHVPYSTLPTSFFEDVLFRHTATIKKNMHKYFFNNNVQLPN